MKNTARFSLQALVAAMALAASCGEGDAQAGLAPEKWAAELVQEAIREMKEAGHYGDAVELANHAGRSGDRRRGAVPDLLALESPQPEDRVMAVVAEYDLFISSSLPLTTLRTYARDIDRLRREEGIAVRMVMRGFVGGMARIRPTIDFITRVITINPGATVTENPDTFLVQVDIDPEKTMSGDQVPALADRRGECVVYGDSTLPDLIARLKDHKCGEIAGHTEKIVEKNAIEELREAAAKVDTDRLQENMRKNLEASLKNLPGAGVLPPCEKPAQRRIVPEAVLEFDIPDPENPAELLYPAGFRFNPLEYGPVHMTALLFAGARPDEVAFVNRWIKQSDQVPASVTLLALGGDYHQLVGQLGRTVYSGIQFVDQGWCEATPCLMTITPGNNWIDVREFVIAP